MTRIATVAAVALLTVSCATSNGLDDDVPASDRNLQTAGEDPSVQPYLPTYPPMEILPLGQVAGLLIEDDGCLWIEREAGRALALWPSGSTIERDGASLVVLSPDGGRAVVGANITAAGGEYGPGQYEMVVQVLCYEVHESCRVEDDYLLVYNVRTEGG
jgi:hypothetical protein